MGNFLRWICCIPQTPKNDQRSFLNKESEILFENEIDENLCKSVQKLLYQQDTPTYENAAAYNYRKNLVDERFQHSVEIVKHILRAESDTPVMMFFDGYVYQPIEIDNDGKPIIEDNW